MQYACNECGISAADSKTLSPLEITGGCSSRVSIDSVIASSSHGNVPIRIDTFAQSDQESDVINANKDGDDDAVKAKQSASSLRKAQCWNTLKATLFSTSALVADEQSDVRTSIQ
jgi:hypothetical protein